ncbi:hypothetical protein, partial [Bellilinea sp.]
MPSTILNNHFNCSAGGGKTGREPFLNGRGQNTFSPERKPGVVCFQVLHTQVNIHQHFFTACPPAGYACQCVLKQVTVQDNHISRGT